MKRQLKFLIMPVLIILFLPSMILAQQQMMQRRFEQEFGTTNEVINRAREMISVSGIDKGRELLKIAEQIQNQAREMGMNQRFDAGIKWTLEAREKARAAMLVNQQADENENLVQRQLEKTESMLDRLRTSMPRDINNMVESLLNTARENQRRAWEFFHNHQLRPALKLSRQVERAINQLSNRIRAMNQGTDTFANQLGRLEARMNHLQDIVSGCNNEQAGKILTELKEHIATAEKQISRGETEKAENTLRLANRLQNQIMEMCQGVDSQAEQMTRLKVEADRIAAVLEQKENRQARRLLNAALTHLEKAERLCAAGDTEECAANIKAAQISLRKAKGLAGI